MTILTKQTFKYIQSFYFFIYTLWIFGSFVKDQEILKQRPALQSLREKHFCQLALQVVTKQVLFLKYFHPFNSNFLCDNFLKGEERSKSKIDLLLPQKSVLQKQNMLYLLLVRGSFLGNQISPTLEFFALRILQTLDLTMFCFSSSSKLRAVYICFG